MVYLENVFSYLKIVYVDNPIIFIGYNIGDDNIKQILKTIFIYVDPSSDVAEKVWSQFLLVEYGKDSDIEENNQILEFVDKIMIQSSQYLPIYSFSLIALIIKRIEQLKKQPNEKLKAIYDLVKTRYKVRKFT